MQEVRGDLSEYLNPLPERPKVIEALIQQILSLIAQAGLKPGDRLPSEKEIIAGTNASRSSVREALRALKTMGIIEARPGAGSFVKNVQPNLLLDPRHLRHFVNHNILIELLELRKLIEVESAALAAQRATPEEIQILQDDVKALERGVAEHRRPDEDLGFHLNIARATHNHYIAEVSVWIATFYQWDPDIPNEKDVMAHRRIYEAISSGDADGGAQAMREHLEEVENRFKNSSENNNSAI